MKKVDRIGKWFDKWLPRVWGFIWIILITVGSVALLVTVIKWLLSVMGVI